MDGFDKAMIASFVVLVGLVIGGIVALIISGAASCPKGQHEQFEYYSTTYVSNGNGSITPVMTPIYDCVKIS